MHGKAQTLKAQTHGFPTCKPGDRPEVIIEFVRGGRPDGLLSCASVLLFFPRTDYFRRQRFRLFLLSLYQEKTHVINTCFAR